MLRGKLLIQNFSVVENRSCMIQIFITKVAAKCILVVSNDLSLSTLKKRKEIEKKTGTAPKPPRNQEEMTTNN